MIDTTPFSSLLLVHTTSITTHRVVVRVVATSCRLVSNSILELKHSNATAWNTITSNLTGAKNVVSGLQTSHGMILSMAYSHLVVTRYLTGTLVGNYLSMSISLVCSTSTLIAAYYYEHSYGLR